MDDIERVYVIVVGEKEGEVGELDIDAFREWVDEAWRSRRRQLLASCQYGLFEPSSLEGETYLSEQ
jgi:hypothetical protein